MDFVSSGDSPGRRLLVHKIVEENFTRHVHKNPDTYSKVLFSGGDKGLFITSPHLYLVVLYGPCVIVYKEVHELFMHFRDIFFAQDTNAVFSLPHSLHFLDFITTSFPVSRFISFTTKQKQYFFNSHTYIVAILMP